MSNDENNVVDSAETTTTDELEVNETSDESTDESEVAENTQGVKPQQTETSEQRIARLKRQLKQEEKKLGIKTEKSNSQEEKVDTDERYQRLELKTEGVTSKKAQDVVLEYARFKGIDPLDALKSPIIKAEIAELEKKTSAPPPSKRTNAGASDSFEYWVAQAKKGNFPRNDKAMMDKLKKARIFSS